MSGFLLYHRKWWTVKIGLKYCHLQRHNQYIHQYNLIQWDCALRNDFRLIHNRHPYPKPASTQSLLHNVSVVHRMTDARHTETHHIPMCLCISLLCQTPTKLASILRSNGPGHGKWLLCWFSNVLLWVGWGAKEMFPQSVLPRKNTPVQRNS